MAGKETPQRESAKGGANEVLGICLVALAVLFLLALFSYDKGDLSFNGTEVNDPRHNLVGILGAWLAQGCFLAVLPVLILDKRKVWTLTLNSILIS